MSHYPDAAEVDISVVIPAYNGERTIADCLESVERATQGRRREIIVVDSSEDATANIVRQRFPQVTVIRSDTRLSAGGARNRGRAAARGRLLFFTDQDCIVPPDWLDRMEKHLEDPTIAAVGGAVGIRNLSNVSGSALYFLEFLNHFPTNMKARRNGNFLVGCNCAYRAGAIGQASFPDQTLGEDILFSSRLRARGLDILYDPSIEVLHHNREGWKEFFRYNYSMGRAAASYHQQLQLRAAAPFLRFPILTFGAPFVVLPMIALDLIRSRRAYFVRFLLLSPMCFIGNLVWASGFRRQTLDASRNNGSTAEPS